MDLELAGRAIIKNLNVRAEHHGEERELGVDLRLQLTTDLDALANFSPALKALLYEHADDPDKRMLRMPQLKPLGLTLEYENHQLCIADQTYDGVKLHKFELAPELDGKVLVAMTASMSKVNAAILPHLAVLYVEEAVNIDIEPAQTSLELVA
jgi:hypothetical protein